MMDEKKLHTRGFQLKGIARNIQVTNDTEIQVA